MKKGKKVVALLLTALLLSSIAITAFAENQYEGNGGNLKETNGGLTKFSKYLVLKSNAEVPNVEFKFTIEEGVSGNSAENHVFIKPEQREETAAGSGIYKGNVFGYPKFVTDTPNLITATDRTATENANVVVGYTPEKPGNIVAENAVPTGTTVDFMTSKTTDEKYAEKEIGVSFEDVKFFEPGVYRYTIKEVSGYTNKAGVDFDPKVASRGGTSCERYLDVYVIDVAGELAVSTYVLHEKIADPGIDATDKGTKETAYDSTPTPNRLKDKSTGFSNWYDTRDLEFKKEVAGNQGSRDKFFQFKVEITTTPVLNDADLFEVIMGGATAKPTKNVATKYSAQEMEKANNTGANSWDNSVTNDLVAVTSGGSTKLYVTGAQLKAGKLFYLQHNEVIRINGLPAGATYAVTEEVEDYKSTAHGVTNYDNGTSGTLRDEDKQLRSDRTKWENDTDHDDTDGVVYTSYKNERIGVIPTGILTIVGPAVAVIALGAVGMGIVFAGKRRREDEEDA